MEDKTLDNEDAASTPLPPLETGMSALAAAEEAAPAAAAELQTSMGALPVLTLVVETADQPVPYEFDQGIDEEEMWLLAHNLPYDVLYLIMGSGDRMLGE